MTRPIITIGNESREMNDDEYADYLAHVEDVKQREAQADADRQAKEQARAAVLAKLGLTADEVAALLG
jgi:hypothetical protein